MKHPALGAEGGKCALFRPLRLGRSCYFYFIYFFLRLHTRPGRTRRRMTCRLRRSGSTFSATLTRGRAGTPWYAVVLIGDWDRLSRTVIRRCVPTSPISYYYSVALMQYWCNRNTDDYGTPENCPQSNLATRDYSAECSYCATWRCQCDECTTFFPLCAVRTTCVCAPCMCFAYTPRVGGGGCC